jgi:hypothetical protein
MTYMTAMARGWDVRNDPDNTNKFSPKWTYNLTSDGLDGGTSYVSTCQVLATNGCVTWDEFPYDGNCREWIYDAPAIWRNAIQYRTDQMGSVNVTVHGPGGNWSICRPLVVAIGEKPLSENMDLSPSFPARERLLAGRTRRLGERQGRDPLLSIDAGSSSPRPRPAQREFLIPHKASATVLIFTRRSTACSRDFARENGH